MIFRRPDVRGLWARWQAAETGRNMASGEGDAAAGLLNPHANRRDVLRAAAAGGVSLAVPQVVGVGMAPAFAADLQTTIDCLVGVDPSVKIWLTGYDILNAQSIVCGVLATIFAGGSTPQDLNGILVGLDAMFASVALTEPNVCYQSSQGTLQGTPGAPDYNNFSPQAFVAGDCIHLTPVGWDLWADQLATFL